MPRLQDIHKEQADSPVSASRKIRNWRVPSLLPNLSNHIQALPRIPTTILTQGNRKFVCSSETLPGQSLYLSCYNLSLNLVVQPQSFHYTLLFFKAGYHALDLKLVRPASYKNHTHFAFPCLRKSVLIDLKDS